MKRDKHIMEHVKKEPVVMPDDISARLDLTLSELHKSQEKLRLVPARGILRAATAVLLLLFFLLPNLNSTVAHAMQAIPIIGELVKVITIRQYEEDDDFHHIQVEIPQISYPGQSTDFINADITELTDTAISRYKYDCDLLPDSHTGLIIDYAVISNNERWFTLQLMVYVDSGSGSVVYKYYHIDKETGESPTLSKLFKSDFNYISAISENVAQQMKNQNAELEEPVYWINDPNMPGSNFSQIEPEQNFYFNDQGELVIVFNKYQVAPGYMGCPEFAIPADIYTAGMK